MERIWMGFAHAVCSRVLTFVMAAELARRQEQHLSSADIKVSEEGLLGARAWHERVCATPVRRNKARMQPATSQSAKDGSSAVDCYGSERSSATSGVQQISTIFASSRDSTCSTAPTRQGTM